MTTTTAVKVDVFPDEFVPLLKVMNKFLDGNWNETLSEDELETVLSFVDDFKTLALQNAGN